MPNGPPDGPDPPWMSMPPLIVAKWICTFAGFVAWTPPLILPVLIGWSSLPRTNVAPGSMVSPPLIVTGPLPRHAAPAGMTSLWYVPAANLPVQVVDEPAPAVAGPTESRAPPRTP